MTHPLIGKPEYSDFYKSDAWRKLRYEVLKKYGAICLCCGAKAGNGVVIHVDHIKPRSRYPALELSFDNLQPLCEDCNTAKSHTDETDWRKS
jgi:5-methylcytosine-specific restriction endonuclease McrA